MEAKVDVKEAVAKDGSDGDGLSWLMVGYASGHFVYIKWMTVCVTQGCVHCLIAQSALAAALTLLSSISNFYS